MSEAETSPAPEDYVWRLAKRKGDPTAHLQLSSEYEDFDGPALTLLMHKIGEALIQAGTMALQSRVPGGDDEEWDE